MTPKPINKVVPVVNLPFVAEVISCGSCSYFVVYSSDKSKGDCVRFPPTVFSPMAAARWPTLKKGEWCGEWKKAV